MKNAPTLRLIVIIALVVVLGLFVIYNWEPSKIKGGFFQLEIPLSLGLLTFAAIGFALGKLWKKPPRV